MKIAILGYGIEGASAYTYYRAKYPTAEFTAYDNKTEPKIPLPAGVGFVGGVKDFKGIEADLAIKTPPIAPWLVEVTGEVTTATREFMKVCPAPIIGVTGTKGKGTTSSLIKSILDAAGKKTWLVGNIGVGAFDVLSQIQPEDVVVYELSSFQLWDADVSPHIAVVLGIEPEHLDVHKDFDDYLNAKANIRRYQGIEDVCVYHPTNEYARIVASTPLVNAPVVDQEYGGSIEFAHRYGVSDDNQVYVRDGFFYVQDRQICSVDHLKIPGQHNIENACAAMSAVTELWLKITNEQFAQGLESFTGLPYRIQKVRELGGVSYYNDSYSTSLSATTVALAAMQASTILIAGGYDRGRDYDDFAELLSTHTLVKKTLLIGQTGKKIAATMNEDTYELCDSLEGAVLRAKDLASPGENVLFSPGCASFDMFKDFNDRGAQFTKLVELV